MDPIIFLLVFLILLIFLLPGIIFFIAFLAAKSRKRKQEAVLNSLSGVEYHAFVRYNKGNQQNEFFKVKAFQGSGVLYVKDKMLYFEDTLHKNAAQFNLKTSTILWQDINLVNGFLKWFSIEDEGVKYYFNIESGMLIWNMNKNKPTTQSVFERLKKYQDEV